MSQLASPASQAARVAATTTVKEPGRSAVRTETVSRPDLISDPAPYTPVKRKSDRTSLVYQVIMGAAACLALIGVVLQSAPENASDVNDPPPAVFVQTD